jgi:hypothetical protein
MPSRHPGSSAWPAVVHPPDMQSLPEPCRSYRCAGARGTRQASACVDFQRIPRVCCAAPRAGTSLLCAGAHPRKGSPADQRRIDHNDRCVGIDSTAWGGRGGVRAETKNMKYAQRVAAAALAVALSGCAGRWFDTHPQRKDAAPIESSPNDFNSQAATYVRDVCALPREERDMRVRALNEALLPNHANISCGRGGYPDE